MGVVSLVLKRKNVGTKQIGIPRRKRKMFSDLQSEGSVIRHFLSLSLSVWLNYALQNAKNKMSYVRVWASIKTTTHFLYEVSPAITTSFSSCVVILRENKKKAKEKKELTCLPGNLSFSSFRFAFSFYRFSPSRCPFFLHFFYECACDARTTTQSSHTNENEDWQRKKLHALVV